MLACCAHHVSDVLPILGVSGAAVFLGAYKTPLLWVGLVMNLVGIAYLVWQLRGLRAARVVSAPSARWPRTLHLDNAPNPHRR